MKKELSSERLLRIGFQGITCVPVRELTAVLGALQRVTDKAFLFQKSGLEPGKGITRKEKADISWRITGHEEGSDLWFLGPFLSDPAAIDLLIDLAPVIIAVLRKSTSGAEPSSRLEEAVAEDSHDISRVVTGGVGGVEGLDIGEAGEPSAKNAVYRASTSVWRAALGQFHGRPRQITGTVLKLDLPGEVARMTLKDGSNMDAVFDTPDFDRVRFEGGKPTKLTLAGRIVSRGRTGRIPRFSVSAIKKLV